MPKMLLNHGWTFSLNDSAPEPVKLPHDWLIGDAHNFYTSGMGKYTRALNIESLDEKENNRKIYLRFEGVYMDSTLFVNGKKAGEWKHGYTTFEFEITEFLNEGANELELTVNFDGQSARWYSGAGIYRDVWLITRNPCHFAPDGIYISTSKKDGVWSWEADAEVISPDDKYDVRHTLIEADGREVKPEDIEEWDILSPRLYTVRSRLYVNGKLSDTADTRIGFRTTEFTTDKGFLLNGRALKINGVCMHHDLGALGAAFQVDAARRQLVIMRSMGVNAIRTAHNPPAPALMDLCDEMGILVMSELTDIWRRAKTPGDYARFFDDWVEKDAASWIRRDRNHPCVILWSIGNEIHDTHVDFEDGAATLKKLMGFVRQHDPKGNAPPTLCSNYMTWENTQKCADIIKIIGYNYNENLYFEHREKHPDWVIYGSETSSTLQSRGVYHFPLSRPVLADDDLQCSTLGNTTTSWGAKNVEACIRDDLAAPFSLGQFVWSGFDYLGEPTPYHTKNCYFGQTDTAGFEKDTYYIFKAAWTDYKEDPFIHVFPYWDFSPGQIIDVRVCSNAPRIALYLDETEIGSSDLNLKHDADGNRIERHKEKWIESFRVPYREGTLRALAYDDNGNVIAEMQRSSFGDVAKLCTETVTYGELDFVSIFAVDSKGRTVENANCRAIVSVEGGELLALDNGDSTDYESYHSNSKRLFNGKLLAVIRRDKIINEKCKMKNEYNPKVSVSICDKDIPVRKIELTKGGADGFDISAKIYPENAAYKKFKDLAWRLTDAGGIDSPMGRLEVSDDGLSARVIPMGDGTGYIRCSTQNGREHPNLISMLEVEVTGMGMPYLNPYEFLSAGLYNACNAEMGSGIERGVATRKLEDSHVGFKGIDFGKHGSDEITLWLFPMGNDSFDFEIWEGMPDDGGELVHTAHYDKGSIWNTYIEVTYKLPRRLRGITTLCLVFRDKVHIMGFVFAKLDKAFSKLYAAECDHIYGDSFNVNPDNKCIEDIGNNVSIIFEDMDFGEAAASKVKLCWRSKLASNSLRVDFENENGGTVMNMLTLPQADEYTEKEFVLDTPLKGNGKVSLVFLPGCNLDLKSIMFVN